MEKIKGTVTFVSNNTKGIKLNNRDNWYNPTDKVKNRIVKALEGSIIEIDCDTPTTFSDFNIIEIRPPTLPDMNKVRSRGASLNTAVELLKAAIQYNRCHVEITDHEQFLEEAEKLAEKIIEWTTKQ